MDAGNGDDGKLSVMLMWLLLMRMVMLMATTATCAWYQDGDADDDFCYDGNDDSHTPG